MSDPDSPNKNHGKPCCPYDTMPTECGSPLQANGYCTCHAHGLITTCFLFRNKLVTSVSMALPHMEDYGKSALKVVKECRKEEAQEKEKKAEAKEKK